MKHPQKGFSLIELMIAITLTLIIIGAIGYFYLGTRQAYRATDNLSQLQENQRVALDVIARDIRMAGYVGCINIGGSQINVIANTPPSIAPGTMAQIYKNGAGWTNPTAIVRVAGTDVIEIRFASGSANVQSKMTSISAQIKIYSNTANFAAGDVLMVSDCSSTDIFRATTVSASSSPVTIAHASSSNTANFLSKIYDTNATIMAFHDVSYFIGTNSTTGKPELYRYDADVSSATPEAIAENVENMQAQYGLDTTGDGAVDAYKTVIPAGANVVALQVGMGFTGTDNYVGTAAQTYYLLGAAYTAADTRLRQAANITVVLRNQALF
jgi:type IV pilus assembly protein PilW